MKISKVIPLCVYYLKYKGYPKLTGDFVENNFSKKYIYGGKKIMTSNETNKYIYDALNGSQGFMAGRFGSAELFMVVADYFELKTKYNRYLDILCNNAGFFPNVKEFAHRFANLMLTSTLQCDVLATWYLMYEEYFMKKYLSTESQGSFLFSLEPWTCTGTPWTKALEGKKVLVIHPFMESIESQYKRRKLIWDNPDILPEFELKTIKAVQTAAGEKDVRFPDWFQALDWMYNETKKLDYDIAIIGCGAYGFPLAAKLKADGKKAIHLGGATQILFGIKGRRWEEDEAFDYIRRHINEYWISPNMNEKPSKADAVENGCYW